MSTFVIKILFLLLPGLVARKVYSILVRRREKKQWEEFLEILLFALGSYVLYGAAASLINALPGATVFDQVFEDDKEIPWHEILWATSFGVVLSFLAAYCFKYKAVLWFGRRIRATRRFGDEDVWTYFQELSGVEWVFVRDHKQDLVYYGWIQAYSDPGGSREMLLRDVDVYDNTGEGNLLYSIPVLYLVPFPKRSLNIC